MTTQLEIIRPANTTAYAAGQVINSDSETTMISFSSISGLTTVLSASLTSSNAASTPDLSLYVFSGQFTIAADGAAFNPSDAQLKANYLGRIKFEAADWAAFGSNKVCDGKPNAPFNVLNDTNYAVLVADSAYTPISGEVLTITISDSL
jgi:hypothetical protein